MRIRHPALGVLAALAIPSAVSGKVVQSSPGGFAVHETVSAKASPDVVWKNLIQPDHWWNKEHSWSGSAANLSIDPRAGGCFCEVLPNGGFVEHMRVIHSAPGSMLRLKGALGPLQGEALDGVLTIELKAGNGGTTIDWTYVVGGYARFPLTDIAPAVDGVMAEQSTRLVSLIETGNPERGSVR